MKYKTFDEWFITGMLILKDFEDTTGGMKKIMRAAWDAAIENYPDDPITVKIKELLNTINDAEKIDCTCDKLRIKHGYICLCVRGGAVKQAGIELVAYLRKLRKSLK